MHDPLLVRGFECGGHLQRHRKRFFELERAARDPIGQ